MVNPPSPQISTVSDLISPRREWAIAACVLTIGLCALAVIFRPEIVAAVEVWITSSSFNHCFLVLPVAAYLAWERRDAVAANLPRPAPWIALLAFPVVVVWFMADRLGIMEIRQLMAMALVQLLFASVLGRRAWRVLAAPLLYLFFLVPFGEFLIPPLQDFTARFMVAGLNLLHIPNFLNGTSVQIPEGTFYVEAGCSGFGFLNASAAFAVLYALVMFRSPLRRVWFVALSLAAPIIANGFRALGILLIAHYITGMTADVIKLDHVQWGWYFFSCVILVMILIGLPFRQTRPPAMSASSPVSGPIRRTAVALAIAPIILLAMVPRLVADRLDSLGFDKTVAAQIGLPALAGCVPAPAAPPAQPATDGLSIVRSGAYRCGGSLFVLTLYKYPPRINAHPLFVLLRAVIQPPDSWLPGGRKSVTTGSLRVGSGPEAPVWQITEAEHGGDVLGRGSQAMLVATALWIAGRPMMPGITARIEQALNSVRRSPVSPVVAVVTHPVGKDSGGPWRALRTFLAMTAQLSQLVSQ